MPQYKPIHFKLLQVRLEANIIVEWDHLLKALGDNRRDWLRRTISSWVVASKQDPEVKALLQDYETDIAIIAGFPGDFDPKPARRGAAIEKPPLCRDDPSYAEMGRISEEEIERAAAALGVPAKPPTNPRGPSQRDIAAERGEWDGTE